MSMPRRIVINDGELQMQDGSSLVAYLREYQERTGIESGTIVSIMPADIMQATIEDARLARGWAS